MAWLRIDDGFTSHPKILALGTPSRRWTWLALLAYTARYRSSLVPAKTSDVVPGATPAFLRDCVDIGLIDIDDEGTMSIHDWHVYNPKDPDAADRMARVRARAPQPRGGRWEKTRAAVYERDRGVCADCGDTDAEAFAKGSRSGWNADHEPSREVLIARGDSIYDPAFIVTRCHSCHSKKTRRETPNTTEHTTERKTERNGANTTEPAFTRAGARVPVPSPTPSTQPAAERQPEDPGPVAAADRLAASGWGDKQLDAAAKEHTGWHRAIDWLDYAENDPSCREPGALAWTKFLTGEWPATERPTLAAGAQGTRSAKPAGHECPHCGIVKAGPASLAEHIENVHYEEAAA